MGTLQQRRFIEDKIKSYKEIQSLLELEKRKLLRHCNHEITITTDEKYQQIHITRKKTYCLLCGTLLAPRKYLAEDEVQKLERSIHIKMDNYPYLKRNWGKACRRFVENEYIFVCEKYPNNNEYELGAKLEQELKKIENCYTK